MKFEVRLDESLAEPALILFAPAMTEEVRQMERRFSREIPALLTGERDGLVEVLDPASLRRIYAAAGRVYAVSEQGEYLLRLRLYEAEARLDPGQFVRISHSEIVNIRQVAGFDLRLSGTICVRFADGSSTYVSRRYVAGIKRLLGV